MVKADDDLGQLKISLVQTFGRHRHDATGEAYRSLCHRWGFVEKEHLVSPANEVSGIMPRRPLPAKRLKGIKRNYL